MSFKNKDNFYVTLPSNASAEKFRKNTLSNFTVMVPTPLELTGNWEVALTEIHYPKRWRNIFEEDKFILHFPLPYLETVTSTMLNHKVWIPPKEHNRSNTKVPSPVDLPLPLDILVLYMEFEPNTVVNRKLYLEKFNDAINDALKFTHEHALSQLSEDDLAVRTAKPIEDLMIPTYFPFVNIEKKLEKRKAIDKIKKGKKKKIASASVSDAVVQDEPLTGRQ